MKNSFFEIFGAEKKSESTMFEQVVEVDTTFLHVQDIQKMFWELQNDLRIFLKHYLIEKKISFFLIKMNFPNEISDWSGTFKIAV